MNEFDPQEHEQTEPAEPFGRFILTVGSYQRSVGISKQTALETMDKLADSYVGDPAARLALQGVVFGVLADARSAEAYYGSKLRPNILREIHSGPWAVSELDRLSNEHMQWLPAAHSPELLERHQSRIYAGFENMIENVNAMPDEAGIHRPLVALLRGIQYGVSPPGIRPKSELELKASINNL